MQNADNKLFLCSTKYLICRKLKIQKKLKSTRSDNGGVGGDEGVAFVE